MVPTPGPGLTYAPDKLPTPAVGSTYPPGKFPTYVPGMEPTPGPGLTYAPDKIPTPAPGSTYAPGNFPTYVPGMEPTPGPGLTYAPDKIPTPAPGSTYAPGNFPTYVPGMVPTPGPGLTYAPDKIPTPAQGSTYAPGKYPSWVPGMEPTPAPGVTYAPNKIPTPAPGSTYAPGKFPTWIPGMEPTPAPKMTYPPYLVPTPDKGSTYAPGEFPTPTAEPTPAVGSTYAPYKPGQVPTPAPDKTYAPDVVPTPAPGSTYAPGMFPTFIPGMVPTPAPGSTFAPWLIPGITPAVGSTYAPFKYPTWVPGMKPTPAPGSTFAPDRDITPGPDGRYPTWVPGMVPTPAPKMTYAPDEIPTPGSGSTYEPGKYPTWVPGMEPTPGPGLTYAPDKLPTPAPGSTYPPGEYPTYVPGMEPTPGPHLTYAPDKMPTPAVGSTYAPGKFPSWVPGMEPTPMPGSTFAPDKVPTPAPGSTYPPGEFPTWVPGMIPTPAPGVTFAPDKVPTPAPGSTYPPMKYPTWVPGMEPTPAPNMTYPPYLVPTPDKGSTYAPGEFPPPTAEPTPAVGSTYAPYKPGQVPTPAPDKTYAPDVVPTPAPGSTYAPGMFPTFIPGMVPTPAPGSTFAPWLIPGITPAVGSTYAPFKYPTWVPGMKPTPAPGSTFAPDRMPTPGPDGRYPTWIPGMEPTPGPGLTYAPDKIPTPAPGSTYKPGGYPTYVPGMVPTPGPGLTYAPDKLPTPAVGSTYPPGEYPTYVPGMEPTPGPHLTYAPDKMPTPAVGSTYAPGKFPSWVPGMEPTPGPGLTYAPNKIPTPAPGSTYAPGNFPTYVPGMEPTPGPGLTYAPDKIPTPAPGSTYAPGKFPTYVPGMEPTPGPGLTYAPDKIPTPAPGSTYAPGNFPTYVPGMVPTPGPGLTYAPDKIPTPGPDMTYAPGQFPTWVPGMEPTPAPGSTYAPDRIPTPAIGSTYAPGNFPTPTQNPYPVPTAIPGVIRGTSVGNETGCLHYGVVYQQGEKWQDGCKYDCECIDYHTGRYECKERCPLFLDLPSYCRLVIDPNDACCKIPVCTTPAPATQKAQTPGTQPALVPTGITPSENPTAQPTPAPTPSPEEGCVMDGTVYVAGQTWYKGCDQKCVCEDGVTGFYRCYDRCVQFDDIPTSCTMVADPKDPTCCQVPQCIPVPQPGNSGSLPTDETITVTGVPGVISGSGTPPVPTSDSFTSAPRNVCVYGGQAYTQGQKWQDGCDYECICTDGMTGAYECTQRCASFPVVPAQCTMQRDPDDLCCFLPVCNQTSILSPDLQPPLSGERSFCVYKGVAYQQGQTWSDGCTEKCRCDDADNNVYTCFDRCKLYNNVGANCVMVADPDDDCCQIPTRCTYVPTPGPTQPGTTLTPPTVCPYPMPTAVPGVITGLPQPDPATGAQPSNVGYCEYKGAQYQQGASWDDGCSYMCTCIDASSGQYQCTEKCPRYEGIPSYCTMAQDPDDKCCTKPACDVCPVTPVTPPGFVGSSVPPTAVPKEVCIMDGKQYTEGQKWTVGCEKICVCDDGKTGAYTCNDRCPSYVQQDGCTLVPDQRDPTCCFTPKCPTDVGVYGTINGSGTPPTPGTNPPIIGTGTPPPSPAPVCVYKGKSYTQGQQWQDGCQYDCTCDDAMTGHYMCTDRCPRYPNLASDCHLVYDPANPCCEIPECPDVTPTPGPGMSTQPTTQAPPQDFCVYQGIAYRQDQTFEKGCEEICKCEDAMTGKITCTDRCPTYPPLASNCVLSTDPQDDCCKIPTCTETNGTVVGVQGSVTGSNLPSTSNNPSTGTRSGCVYNNQVYQQGQMWDDGCKYTCECLDDATGRYTCTEKCARLGPLPSYCTLTTDPDNACCEVPYCQPTPAPGPGPTAGPTPQPIDACVYKGSTYRQNQQWFDDCDFVCTCDNATINFYSCQQRCATYETVQQGCMLVADPDDPTCCEVPSCPIFPPTGPSPTPGIFTVAPQPGGVITGSNPTAPPGSTLPPPYRSGCLYKGQLFYQGQMFDDGCDYECECLDNMTGKYRCTEKCPTYGALPTECVLMQDPKKPCCQVPFCDFTNPTPFPDGVPTPMEVMTPTPKPGVVTVAPYVISGQTKPPRVGMNTSPSPVPSQAPQGYCQYKGVYYSQGQTWDDGCDLTCRCEDVMKGYYTCSQRCPSYPPSNCTLEADPSDPCCLMPDCSDEVPSPAPTPGADQTTSNPVITPQPITGSFTGISGGNNAVVQPLPGQSVVGSTPACVYKGSVYRQDATWEDGCSYNCECIDASRGQYRCTDRCPRYPNLPSSCHFVQSQTDACCQAPVCDLYIQPPTQAPVTPPTIATTTTPLIITPASACVYTDGTTYPQDATWQDGCSVNCECMDAGANQFFCTNRCPVFSGLPSMCTLEEDPADTCCMKPVCTLPSGSTLAPLIGNATPPPTSLQVLPIGTHAVFVGYAKPTNSAVEGGSNQCVFQGVTYKQGQSWDDGCDYVCTCENSTIGMYRCTSKCPDYPQLPSYCKSVKVPGQCCPSITCDIPGYGTYTPTPELVPTPRPSAPPGGTTSNPYVIVANPDTPVSGGSLPGGGYYYPNASSPDVTGQLRDKCVYKNRLYNQGETWEDGCDYSCECQDARTGYYVCNPRCPVYSMPSKQCNLVKADGQCCSKPVCYDPDTGNYVDPIASSSNFPVVGSYAGGFTGFRPYTTNGSPSTGSNNACVYKAAVYQQGDTWVDGCDFECECLNATRGLYECTVICPTYTNIPPVCTLDNQPDSCCKKLSCTNTGPDVTAPPGSTPIPPTQPDNDPCQDKLDNCKDYTNDACGTAYGDWGARNCARFCNVCQPLYTSPAPVCEDKHADCKDYGLDACTGIYRPWAEDNCSQFCGFCTSTAQPSVTTPSVAVDECKDNLAGGACSVLDKTVFCVGEYMEFALESCKKYCDLCDYTTTTLPTTTVPAISKWMLFLKGVAGAPGPDLYQLWHSSEVLNPDEPLAPELTSTFNGHYKPGYSNHWDEYCIDQVKVSIYNNGVEKAYIIFDATGADKDSWLTQDRIISSTYTDIKTASMDLISMAGDSTTGQEFYINGHTSSPDPCIGSSGWMMVSTQNSCFYEAGDSKPTFYYAPGTTQIEWDRVNAETGDVFAITAHATCQPSGGVTNVNGQVTNHPDMTTPAPTCLYNGQQYLQDETWNDGCDYKCHCADAAIGTYRCRDLCSKYTNLPPNCAVHKEPDECCGQPVCVSTTSIVDITPDPASCVYDGQYYGQDETWNIGCNQFCTCTNAMTQEHSCRAVCLRWASLPDVCTMEDPPPGLCCMQPRCPPNWPISIPTAYKSQYPGNYTYV